MQTLHDKIEVASHHAEKKMVSSYADMVKQIGTNLEDSSTTSGLIPPLVIAKQDDNLVRETQERQQRARKRLWCQREQENPWRDPVQILPLRFRAVRHTE